MKRQQIFSLWCVVFFLCLSITYNLPAHAARRALVIGISKYDNDKDELVEVRNDAKSVADALKNVGFIVAGDKAQLDLKEGDLKAKITDFIGSIQPDDTALFYFSGHGIESQLLGENFLISAEGNSAVQLELDVLDKIGEKTSAPKIVILDTCRKPSSKEEGLLKPKALPLNSIIAYGSAPQRSIVYPSQYTKTLLDHLQEPGLEITGLLRITKEHFITQSELLSQQPNEFGGLTEKFYFRQAVGISTQINTADDNLTVYINGEIQRNYSTDHSTRIRTLLKSGQNDIKIVVYNRDSFTPNKVQGGGHQKEGWNYNVDFFNDNGELIEKITDGEDGEPPDDRFGKDFVAAHGTIFVDPKSAKVTLNLSKTISNRATKSDKPNVLETVAKPVVEVVKTVAEPVVNTVVKPVVNIVVTPVKKIFKKMHF